MAPPSSSTAPLRIVAVLALAAAAAVGAVGCDSKYPSCKKDKHCNVALGEACVDGACQGCTVDADCAGKAPVGQPNYVCREFRCQDAAAAGPEGAAGGGEEGDPCAARSDCLGGLACMAGMCGLCTGDADCGGVPCNLDSGRCSPTNSCATDDQCAMDEICDGGMCIFSGDLGDDDGGGPCGLSAVYFAFDSEVLTPKTKEDLDGIASCMAEAAGGEGKLVYLEAHADNRGTEEYNILLTERRGTSVKSYLAEKGVTSDAMQVIAKGSLEAIGSDESTRSKERRVQFIWP